MKQVVQDVRSGRTQVLEVPVPVPAAGRVLVRTEASLLSAGTERSLIEFAGKSLLGKARSRPDLVRQTLKKLRREGLGATFDAVRARLSQPVQLAYSSAGPVVELGEGVSGLTVGDSVACAGGGYAVHAEYAVVPTNLLAPVPVGVSLDSAAFTTLGSIAMHGFRLTGVQVGERVAVIGLGLLGQLALQIARAAGCHPLGIDLDATRVDMARRLGHEAALRVEADEVASTFTQGLGFDAVLICADTEESDPVELAGELARDRGCVVVVGAVGMEIPRRTYYDKELRLSVSRSYGPGRYDTDYEEGGQDYPYGYVRWTEGRNMRAFLDLLASGDVDADPLITHRFPVEKAEEAYQLLTSKGHEPYLGVLLLYPGEERIPAEERRIALAAPPARVSRPVRLGALGAGSFAAGVALPLLRKIQGVELVGLATASGANAATAGRRFGFRYAAADEDEILKDPQINTVAVFTRHGDHARQVAAALRAGKHVFCEKPLAINRPRLDEIISALGFSDGLLTVGFNRRFAPHAQRLRDFLEPVGEPLVAAIRVNAGFLPPDHWLHDPEQGGGRIIGEAIHFIDLLAYLTGQLPTQVQAWGTPHSERYREGNVLITLRFPDGSLGTVAYLANGDPALPKERIEVTGGGRMAVLDDFRRLVLASSGRRKVYRSRWRQDKGHRALWQAFVDALRGGGQPPVPYDHVLAAHLTAFAAVDSLRSGEPAELDPVIVEEPGDRVSDESPPSETASSSGAEISQRSQPA